ncbi:MAG: EF-P lysine aminoacylase GenX [Lentisphaerae bacterium]|nr:EF-P lysine aminoacylase GenX [Lentisphaerota bacterium]
MNHLTNLKTRSALLKALRDAFYAENFFEVATAVKIPAPAPEEYIESVQCADGEFLRTSPELAMKRMLVAGMERIFQIGAAFRAEEVGRKHREEFTILEYYAVKWDYRELAEFTARMISQAAQTIFGQTQITYQGFPVDLGRHYFITVDEAFRRYAGVSAFDADADGSFDELMVLKVEPELGKDCPEFLIDYPANRASLSRLSAADNRVAERWELYIRGMELGNAFGELTDAAEQRRRFASALKFRAEQGMLAYPEATDFLEALEKGLPKSSGCAIGFDRLCMIFCDSYDIAEVIFE